MDGVGEGSRWHRQREPFYFMTMWLPGRLIEPGGPAVGVRGFPAADGRACGATPADGGHRPRPDAPEVGACAARACDVRVLHNARRPRVRVHERGGCRWRLGNRYHNHCDCEPVPSWGETKLAGYDPGRLDALYKDAAQGLPDGASYKDVLARMRAQGGVADSPATQAGSGGGKPPKPPKTPKATAAAANDGPERWADENAVFVRNREGETVCISNRVIGHIIDGDAKGGGHSAHATKPGKSHFPASWSDDKIKGEIEITVAYPDEIREIAPGKRILTRGVDGTSVTVVVVKTKKGWKVRTAYPEVDDKRGLDT